MNEEVEDGYNSSDFIVRRSKCGATGVRRLGRLGVPLCQPTIDLGVLYPRLLIFEGSQYVYVWGYLSACYNSVVNMNNCESYASREGASRRRAAAIPVTSIV